MAEKGTGKDTRLIQINPGKPEQTGIDEAVRIVRHGGVVSYPTESFYGLGVDPAKEDAVRRLFHLKGREKQRPVLILIPSIESLDEYVIHVPPVARVLVHAFWPGGLTLVFHAAHYIPTDLTGGSGKIGIRVSSHPIAASLARALHGPVTSTSANVSGAAPCRSGQEVAQRFRGKVDIVLNGGRTEGKSASTVLDVTVDPPRLLRDGMVSREELQRFIPV